MAWFGAGGVGDSAGCEDRGSGVEGVGGEAALPTTGTPGWPSPMGGRWQRLSALRFPETPTVHDAPVVVEHPPCLGIFEGIVRTELPCGGQPADEAGLLAVDQRMGAAVPGPSPALNEPEQMHEPCDMAHVMYNVLEPPLLDDRLLIDPTDRVLGHQARFVGPTSPWLLVVHDVSDFIVVRSGAVLFDVVAPRLQGLHFVVRKDGGVRMHDRMVVDFALVTYRREEVALQKSGVGEDHQRLVRIARENHLVERLLYPGFVLDHDVG